MDRNVRIAVPDYVSNSYFLAIAARELGFLDRAGIRADVQLIYPVTRAMEALRNGDVEFVAGAAHATVEVFPLWRGAKLLASLSKGMYWFLVVHVDAGGREGSLEALRGLRVGAAPGPDAGLRRALRDAGIDAESRGIRIEPIPMAAGITSFGVNAARALEMRQIDAFWANGMAAEIATRRGVGSVLLDARRGPLSALTRRHTFPALVTTDRMIEEDVEHVSNVVRGLVACQDALKADPSLAGGVGKRVFPELEASLIVDLIARDAPFYEAAISNSDVESLTAFCRDIGSIPKDATIEVDDVVSSSMRHLWGHSTTSGPGRLLSQGVSG